MRKRRGGYQTYADGWGTVWEIQDRRFVKIRQEVLHFQEQTVGERRFWDAYVAGAQITRTVRVPYGSSVEQGDVFVIDGKQYEVVQKDLKDDRLPASWLLSLASAVIGYRGGSRDGRTGTDPAGAAGSGRAERDE